MTLHDAALEGILWRHTPRPQAALRLVCFPPAGGHCLLFAPWEEPPARLPETIELWSVQLPRAEPWIVYDRLVSALADVLLAQLPHDETPLALFGHSLGGLLAWGVARELRMRAAPAPLGLVVASAIAPQLPVPDRSPQTEEPADWQAFLRQMGGTPEGVLQSPDDLSELINDLRCDFATHRSFSYSAEAPCACPILTYGGSADAAVPLSALLAWQSQTAHMFGLRVFPGGHFFWQDVQLHPLFVRTLAADLLFWLEQSPIRSW